MALLKILCQIFILKRARSWMRKMVIEMLEASVVVDQDINNGFLHLENLNSSGGSRDFS